MSTSDQHPHAADLSAGSGQLTRKQLREARLTGSTPIVTPEEAEAARQSAQAEPAAAAPAVEEVSRQAGSALAVAGSAAPVADPAPPAEPAAPVADPSPAVEPAAPVAEEEPLTRRQIREQERIRTASVPVLDESTPAPVVPPRPASPAQPEPVSSSAGAQDEPAEPAGMITDVPRPAFPMRRRTALVADEQDGVDDAEQAVAPVSASAVMRAEEASGRAWSADPAAAATPVAPAPPEATGEEEPSAPSPLASLLADSEPEDAVPAETEEPTVNAGFGQHVLAEHPQAPAPASFDALIGDSTGSHHAAPNALIFQQAPAGPSLSGPVASTGEILVTGSYELPAGLGSRGHADGVADGKEVDAVLVDGELAPSSSPTPIAASAAIGTIKPAGEVIRPPEPEKSSKLMLALTITAGALAVALVGALIVAITTGAFS